MYPLIEQIQRFIELFAIQFTNKKTPEIKQILGDLIEI